jgi:ABC-type phosphate transport system substrate-binding protein
MSRFNRIRPCVLRGLALCFLLDRAVLADVVAVVSAKNPVSSLSKSQVADLFLGKTARFPDGTLAVPIDQEEGSAARQEFYATFTGKSPAQIKTHWTKMIFTGRGQPPIAALNVAEVKHLLAENPRAISYIERSAVDSSIKVLTQP